MKPRPQYQRIEPDYPPTNGLRIDRRGFLRLISAAGLTAAAIPALAGDPKAAKKADAKTVEQTVKKLATQLGVEDFGKRRAATKGLILVGKGDGKDKAKDAETKEFVLAEMRSLLKHRDPEVSQRAKQVILALDPPKPKLPPDDRLEVPGW